ncbi:MAG: hypothetical protein A2314_05190 [Elusimicrobia bacterium RIFOXYB2_FULL_50_12]|nr:MAG: hypothetical protein A2314_05190 [Elusimicrobia bacterium RIFOXYB2_FULL_50_12]
MKLILTIAWRNILRHKSKSLIIGFILFLGALLMTLGNGVISGMDRGISKNIVNGFLGDIVIISEKQKTDNILLNMMGTSIEPIYNYKQIKQALQSQDYLDRFLPAGKNLALALTSESNQNPGFAFMLGVDFEAYRKMFPNAFTALEGGFLEPGKRGILVPVSARNEFFDYTNIWIIPEHGALVKENLPAETQKDPYSIFIDSAIVLMGMNESNSSTDIRFPVKGIIKYRALNTIFGHFSITDIESYRECLGYFSATGKSLDVPKEEQKLLSMESGDLDALFSEDTLMVSNERTRAQAPANVLQKNTPAPQADIEDGAYNLVFVKLKGRVSEKQALTRLNKALTDAHLGVRAITWKKASGPIGGMASLIKGALFIFVMLLFVVAIIIIINTLTMSALERTPEIGMMRAIGAKKSFISGMFLGETAILSAFFGGAGIVCGIIIVKIIPLLKIRTANDMLQILYGGDVFSPVLNTADILTTLVQLGIVTLCAALYPMLVARNITPLEAIARD